MAGLTEANSDWGSHSIRKGGIPSTLGDDFPASLWFSEEKSNSSRTCGKPQEGGTLWYNTVGVDHFYVMNVDKVTRKWSDCGVGSV